MTSENLYKGTTKEFLYTVNYIRDGFIKLADLLKNEKELLYQSSKDDYASINIEKWTPNHLNKALLYLSKHLLNPHHTTKILYLFEQSILEIVRYALASEADHTTKCITLGTILFYRPNLIQYFLSYFDDKSAPWEINEDRSKSVKRMKLPDSEITPVEIVEACWFLLKSDLNYFREKWDWSYFIKKYIKIPHAKIKWIISQCIVLLLGMNEEMKAKITEKFHSRDAVCSYYHEYEVQRLSFHSICSETLNFDNKQSKVFIPLYQPNVKDLTVNIAGVPLPVSDPRNQVKEGCLVETESTLRNLRRIAIGISTGKAVCLSGPVGSGKTSLISHLALLTGRNLSKDVLKVQLGEETDSKLLLGTYQCTDIPGEFIWSPGMLTKAVVEGCWLLLEDIGSATSDVAALLANLLEEKTITIPGYKDSVRPSPGFHLFMTQRLVNNLPVHHRKDTFSTELLEGHWLKVNLEPLNRDELVQIIQTKHPLLKTIATRMTSVYLLFSQGNHEEGDSVQVHAGCRLISTRDLFKWCRRAEIEFDVSSVDSALKVFQDAIDIFCCSYSSEGTRLELAGQVASCLGIIKTKAEYFCCLYKPSVSLTPTSCVAGRGVLPRVELSSVSSLKSLTEGMKYALTQGSCCLLERVAVCLSLDEPALLVGETGTGKTTTLQLLAKQTGHKLIVINMNQQSDSSDLLGGFKPIDTKQVIMPLRDEFEELFRSFFNVQKNLKFLENISVCISNRRWMTLLKLMIASQNAAVRRLFETGSDKVLLLKWQKLGDKMEKLQTQLKQNESAMAFSFVEGSLIQAMKEGNWVLLDEINLASAETLQCLSGLLEGSTIHLLERGDEKSIVRHKDFRIMAAMNPATDFGKKDLPPGIRNRFTELFVSEHTEKSDLSVLVSCYLPDQPPPRVDSIVDFYLTMKRYATEVLSDGSGNRPHYSLRTLCRALIISSENRCGSITRSLYEALCLSFLTQLNSKSHELVKSKISSAVADKADIKSILSQPIPEPITKEHVPFEGYWVSKGDYKPYISKKYILTGSVRRNLCDLARVVSLSNHPVLVQGETSVGKTSLIIYLAEASGHKVLRINNHQHTDLQEYVGSYCADSQTGSLIFKEGVLAQAMRRGDWIILDELNLAPSEVLEALNRVLDDNRELFIPETSVTIKAHPDFRIFATQNPPGTYGGRKMLSRAFRNRFVELHFGEIPSAELEQILHQRCDMPLSYCKKLVAVMSDLQVRRRGSAAFAGKQGYITLRDLFRWGERYRLASRVDHLAYHDWDQHVADEGYLVLAGRVRKQEEQQIIKEVIEKRFKRTINLEKLFTLSEDTSLVTKHILEKIVFPPLPSEFKHIVWTLNLRKLAVLVGKALEFKEPILLVGDTGCGKTTICQLLAALNGQLLYSVNCHQHSESSDFLGGLRPVRENVEKSGKLFEWVDGPLIIAMKEGEMFLVDEISLADDSVLERLNSLLEPERKLLVSEKGSGDDVEIVAQEKFHFIGTMNPGGDFGKKELSPALRNRLTEIWCEVPSSEEDLISIVEHNVRTGISLGKQDNGKSGIGRALVEFIMWFSKTDFGKRISISVRDLLVWVNFINKTGGDESTGALDVASAYLHGGCLTLLDGIGSANTASDNISSLRDFKQLCVEFLLNQISSALGTSYSPHLNILLNSELVQTRLVNVPEKFGLHPFYIEKGPKAQRVKQEFQFEAPTTCVNVMRLLRALQVASRAVLLEGSPGVGKTSLVLALAEVTGNQVTRINLSEQTDVSDLFGSDLPVEGAEGGTFAWSDGPFLKALKQGHWILLDELNLASQSVVEGLNSVLDHRGEIFIPELGRSFKVKVEETKLFACQNPQRQGGARKGLPQSFLNRFTQVFVEPLCEKDLEVIISGIFPTISADIRQKMVRFHNKICSETWESPGVWEFNLRDLIRWGQTVSEYTTGVAVETIYAARMPKPGDKNLILRTYEEIFGCEFPLASPLSPILFDQQNMTIGEIKLSRRNTDDYFSAFSKKNKFLILRNQQPALKSLVLCVKKGWMSILVGKIGSGKSSLVHVLAQLAGRKLNTVPVSSAMDTTDLLGGFEQTDLWRHLDRLAKDTEVQVMKNLQKMFITSDDIDSPCSLYSAWHGFLHSADNSNSKHSGYEMKENESKFQQRCKLLRNVIEMLPVTSETNELKQRLTKLVFTIEKSGLQAGGVFEWVDSTLIRCVEKGEWLLLDNVNLCSGAVLDRLNSLLESGGMLALGERGSADHVITPHPDFRIFLTLDPKHGAISRAMRNRGVEIYLDVPDINTIHPFDLDSLLFNCGLRFESHRNALIDVHNNIIKQEIGPEQPGLQHLLEVAYISSQNWKQGFPLFESIQNAIIDVYIKSRSMTQRQKESLSTVLKEILFVHKDTFSENTLRPVDFFWPEYKTLSTFSVQEDPSSSIAMLHGSILYGIMKNFEKVNILPNWPKEYTWIDIVGSSILNLHLKHAGSNYNVLDLLPFLILTYFNCGSVADVLLRRKWIEEILKFINKHRGIARGSEIFTTINQITQLVCNYITEFDCGYDESTDKAGAWDKRQMSVTNVDKCWVTANRLLTLVYYRFIVDTAHPDINIDPNKSWWLMSALEYSKAIEKGNIADWPFQHGLILELYPLLTAFDDIVISALRSNKVLVPDDLCAELIYKLAWRFKLSTVARRRLFLVSKVKGTIPPACSQTISVLELHYAWFRKHCVPSLMNLVRDCLDMEEIDNFTRIINKIDSALNFNNTGFVPVARKFRKQMVLPSPHSSVQQFDLSKKVFSLESDVDIWRSSSKLISKINFLASLIGQNARNKIFQAATLIHEDKGLDLVLTLTNEVESEIKEILSREKSEFGLNELSTIKLWPLLELICLKLNCAVRRIVISSERSSLDSMLVESHFSWFETTGCTSPIAAAIVRIILNQKHMVTTANVQLMHFLSDYPNVSPTMTFPSYLLNWENTANAENLFGTFFEDKESFVSHMPLMSLFLSRLFSGISSQHDTPSFALKAHRNMNKMFQTIKLLVWRNLPAIYSDVLCNRINEALCVEKSFECLYKNLKTAINAKYKDSIITEEPLEILAEISKFLTSVNDVRGITMASQSPLTNDNGLVSSLSELYQIMSELQEADNDLERWLLIGEAWAHIGRVNLLLFGELDVVDPVQKKAIKLQYIGEEISELRKLLCAEELTKTVIGAPPVWPLKKQHEKRISDLEVKQQDINYVTVRPSPSLYNEILQDIVFLRDVLISNKQFRTRLSSLIETSKSSKITEVADTVFTEAKNWLTSLHKYSEKLYTKYYVSYPDIICPLLLSLAQINYGLKIVLTTVEKQLRRKRYRGGISVESYLEMLSTFPLSDAKSALELLSACSSAEIVSFLNKCCNDENLHIQQDNKIKLIKICIRIVKSISKTYAMESASNTFFQVLDHVVSCWHQIQEQEKLKKAQEDSIYINRMKLTEEELLERERKELFPSSREKDFGDLEEPDTLEGAPPVIEDAKSDPLRLSAEEIAEICLLHSEIVRESVSAHWLSTSSQPEDSPLSLLKDRMSVFSVLVNQYYSSADDNLDSRSILALMLASNFHSIQPEITIGSQKHYDFYRDSNIAESRVCIPLLNAIKKRVDELLVEWPDHPTLNQILVIIDRVTGFSMGSPLSRFLTGLELLLSKLHHWEENAHAGVSLAQHSTSLTQHIIQWRKLELSAWKGALHSTFLKVEANARKWWFHIYALVTSFIRNTSTEPLEDETEELVKSLQALMETSTLGEYSVRLELLYTFHCHALVLPSSQRRNIVSSVLWNIYSFYNLFTSAVTKVINELTAPIEKKLKDFVKIARWNDINYWAVKSAVDKTHHSILKHIKEYEKILNEPARGAMVKVDISKSISNKVNLCSISESNFLTSCNLPESYIDIENSERLFSRLNSLFKKSRNISTHIIKKCSYPKLLDDLEALVDEIEETGILINEFDIDISLPKEKRKGVVKSLLQRKRKAISDLFKILSQIGLSYRSGLHMFEQKNITFTKLPPIDIKAALNFIDSRKSDKIWLSCWKGTEHYFYASVAKMAVLKIALEKPHKDLGPLFIERIKGYTAHSNSVLTDVKENLTKSVLSIYSLRSQIVQILNMTSDDYGIIDSNFNKNKVILKDVTEDISYCMKQFILLFDACPEQEVNLGDNLPIPLVFPDGSKSGMVNAFKHDPIWELTKAKVESILASSSIISKQISTLDKHSFFVKSLSSSCKINVDTIIVSKAFKTVEDSFEQLRKIYACVVEIEKLFEQTVGGRRLTNPLTFCLEKVKKRIDEALNAHINVDYPLVPKFSNFSELISAVPTKVIEKFEVFLNKALCIMQNIYKIHALEDKSLNPTNDPEKANVDCPETQEESGVILDGHLKEKVVESLFSDLRALRMFEISEDLQIICSELLEMENCLAREACQGLLRHVCPILDQLISLYHYFIVQLTSSVKVLGKFSTSLSSVFTDFVKNGYKIPEELLEEEEGEGETQKGGLGLGEGEGEKDVSEQIESEDQLEDARKPGDYGNDEEKDCKEEEKGVEMSEDFGGKLQDVDKKDDEEKSEGEEEKDEDLDKEMGETEKGADTLDKEIWGSDSEEEADDNEELPKDEKGNKGEQQSEKELGAKEEEDKTEVGDKEDKKKKEPKEKDINEMEEPEIDDDHIDPYHGKQQPSPEVEPLELQDEDMALDNDEDKGSEKDEEENPFDIDTMKKKIKEEQGPEEKPDSEEESKDTGENEERNDESDDEPTPDVKKPEEEKLQEEETAEEGPNEDDGTGDKVEEEVEEKTGNEETSGADEQPAPLQTESSEKIQGSKDQVKNDEKMDVDPDVDPEETKAEGKEQSGSGKAENVNVDSGGHRGEVGKRKNIGDREQEEHKPKPGQSEIERSLGEVNEPVKKKLKTIGLQKEQEKEENMEEDNSDKIKEDTEADLYQHIHEAKKSQYDAQTVDAATEEQAEKQPTIGKDDEEKEETDDKQEITNLDEDDIEIDIDTAKERESSQLEEGDKKEDSAKNKGEGGGTLEEAKVEVEGEYVETATVARGMESSFHTRMSETTQEPMSESELLTLRQQLQEQLASWRQPPERAEAVAAWEKVCNVTRSLAQQLSEELRLVLEPTTASSLRGDFRTGKRINMRKVIPYIASQFRKDKIWLRRTKPSKREYQIILAIDDSSSMADNKAKELAFESLAVVSKALNLIEAGELAVISFGEKVRVLHQLGEPFTESSGARLLQEFSFDQTHTRVGGAVETALGLISRRGPDSAQLLVIVSDGRGVMSEGEQAVRSAVRKASHSRLFIVFIIIDSPTSKDSILDIRLPVFSGGKLLEIKSYMDNFPFPFYLILRDIANLPSVLSDALRQWFELVTDVQ